MAFNCRWKDGRLKWSFYFVVLPFPKLNPLVDDLKSPESSFRTLGTSCSTWGFYESLHAWNCSIHRLAFNNTNLGFCSSSFWSRVCLSSLLSFQQIAACTRITCSTRWTRVTEASLALRWEERECPINRRRRTTSRFWTTETKRTERAVDSCPREVHSD